MNKDPLYKILSKNGDLLTPVGIFKRLKGEKKFLLESSLQHETKGKYSFAGANPIQEIIGYGHETTVIHLNTDKQITYQENALHYLKNEFPKFDLPIPFPFIGGAIGYVGYDIVRQFATIGPELPDDLNMPDVHLMVYDTVIVYEHRTETTHIIALGLKGESEKELQDRLTKIERELDTQILMGSYPESNLNFQPQVSKQDFIRQVEKTQQILESEGLEQIVISQRMVAHLQEDPFTFYRQLRIANPSPYMFFIQFSEYTIVGASPESLVKTEKNTVITNPIAGTRPRGKTEEEDTNLSNELLRDEKEIAEHEMLVTLSQNDLEKICVKNSITTPVHKQIEKYEHVMHIVSEVHGKLRKGVSSIEALIACLPAGTVSGSPRIKAMQMINEIEHVRRGFYAGGVGYITFNHDINLAIAIRSLVVKDNRAYLQTGAGIVAQSNPEKEYEETLHKAKSLTNLKKIRQLS